MKRIEQEPVTITDNQDGTAFLSIPPRSDLSQKLRQIIDWMILSQNGQFVLEFDPDQNTIHLKMPHNLDPSAPPVEEVAQADIVRLPRKDS